MPSCDWREKKCPRSVADNLLGVQMGYAAAYHSHNVCLRLLCRMFRKAWAKPYLGEVFFATTAEAAQ